MGFAKEKIWGQSIKECSKLAINGRSISDSAREIDSIYRDAFAKYSVPGSVLWLKLLTMRQVWGLMLCKALGDGVWYFITFWLPKYLMDVRGFNIKAVGNFAWLPWAGAGAGCVLMGLFSSWLIQRGWSDRYFPK